MAQEDNRKCSSTSNSKKPKQKKIPQRGLGVAQLEKIRVEEEKKNVAVAALAAASSSASVVVRSSPIVFASQNPSARPSTDLPSFRPRFDTLGQLPSPPLVPSQPVVYPRNNYNAFGHQSSSIALLPSQTVIYGHNGMVLGGHANYQHSASNSCELRNDREGPKLNPGFMFQSRLHNDMNSTGSSSSSAVMQNQHYHHPHHQQQQQQNQFPKMNASNNSMSSGVNLQIEPPSNQSYHSNYSNYRLPPWPEDDKMVGMKRSWPFSVENPPSPSVDCNNHRSFLPRNSATDERSPYENGGTMYWDPRNSFLREGPSDFAANQLDSRIGMPEWKMENGTKENGASIDTVLTLGLPTAPTSPIRIKAKQPLEFPSPSLREFSDFNMPPHQDYMGTPYFGQGESAQPQHVYSFFPPKAPQNGHVAANSGDQRSEMRDKVDLNLKL